MVVRPSSNINKENVTKSKISLKFYNILSYVL